MKRETFDCCDFVLCYAMLCGRVFEICLMFCFF